MMLSFKNFFRKIVDDYKESQKPENVKKRLTEQIEVEKLKSKLDEQRKERHEANKDKWKITIGDEK